VAVDGHGNAAATTNPAGGAGTWSLSKVAAAFTGIYCASTTLCLGLDAGAIITTTNPTAGASAWASPVVIDAHPLTGVSCASGGALCVAVDGVGDALTSTNPTGGAAAWQSAAVTGGDSLTGVACPLVTRCIAVGQNGDVLTSSTPTNSAAWSLSIAETGVATLTGVTCPSPTECVATDSSGNVLVTTDPAATSPAWTVTHVAPSALYQPACATTCVARDAAGDIFTSTNPAAAAPVWSGATLVNAPDALTSLGGCQATGSGGSAPAPCVLTDSTGNVLVSTDPAGGPAAWVAAAVDTPPCGACVSEQVWAHDDLATRVLDDVLPGPGTVLAGVAMAGDSTTLTWTHSGSAQAYTLR
jgi:hypothetical protein